MQFNGNMNHGLMLLSTSTRLWRKYVDTEKEFLTLCNFGLSSN
uniref:Uncharacterized protein n=1 Tax=Aegilops tauschii subsp. strangulata TaxID=200361 RepID=A0A453AVK8_AEGTS